MTSKSSSRVPTLNRPDAIPPHIGLERQASWSSDRSSLDIPRGSSPWDVHSENQHYRQRITNGLDEPMLNRHEPGYSPRQRPLSMGPYSPSRSPRISKSPPKSSHLPPKPFPLRSPASAPIAPVTKDSRLPHISKKAEQYLPLRSADLKQSKLPAVAAASLDNLTVSRLPLAQDVNKRRPLPPPPIKRAEKPKIPSKLATRLPSAGRASLEPGELSHIERVSPFSTPPSSDESPNAETNVGIQAASRSIIKTTSGSHPQEGYFPPPPKHHSTEERNEILKTSNTHDVRRSDPRQFGFSRTTSSLSDHLQQRPGLPPRPDLDTTSTGLNQVSVKAADLKSHASDLSKTKPDPPVKQAKPKPSSAYDFLPPPKRVSGQHEKSISSNKNVPVQQRSEPALNHSFNDYKSTVVSQTKGLANDVFDKSDTALNESIPPSDYPDASNTNRRFPCLPGVITEIETKYDTRLFDIFGRYVCTTGYLTKIWDVVSGDLILSLSPGEKEIKVTSIAFKPGANAEEEGLRIWLGTNYGEIQEVDLPSQQVIRTKSNAHSRREIIKMYRYQNSMWSLDDDGRFHIWLPDKNGLPSLQQSPVSHRIPKGHTFSMIIKGNLWLATGKEIRIFNPSATTDESFQINQQPIVHSTAGEVTSGATISNQHHRVYFGHTDGKVTIYSTSNYTCLGVVNVSVYKINSLAGVGFYLWAGYNTGMIYVYDTRTNPWLVKKDWHAHEQPVTGIMVNRSSVWKLGHLQVASIGVDNAIRMWDGMLEDDWLGEKYRWSRDDYTV